MAFVKRTWLARIGQGLNKFIIGEKDANDKQTLVNSPDSVTQQGDVISADNLNDLEDRIEDGFDEKQDALTFDDVPTENSNNPVKSGGVYSSINAILQYRVLEVSMSFGAAAYSTGENHLEITPSLEGYSVVGIVGWRVKGNALDYNMMLGADIYQNKVRIWFNTTRAGTYSFQISCRVLFVK